MSNLTSEQHIEYFNQQAQAILEEKAQRAVLEVILPNVKVPIAQAVEMMDSKGKNPGKFNMELKMIIHFTVEVAFKEKNREKIG